MSFPDHRITYDGVREFREKLYEGCKTYQQVIEILDNISFYTIKGMPPNYSTKRFICNDAETDPDIILALPLFFKFAILEHSTQMGYGGLRKLQMPDIKCGGGKTLVEQLIIDVNEKIEDQLKFGETYKEHIKVTGTLAMKEKFGLAELDLG